MSVRTKGLPTKSKSSSSSQKSSKQGKPWREVAKDLIDERSEIGVALRGYRTREGLTQKELAERLGDKVKQSHISEMERGVRPIGKAMAKKLALALDTDYRMFL